jgi:hypothetical protein
VFNVPNRRQFQVNTEPADVGNTFATPFRGCTKAVEKLVNDPFLETKILSDI